MKRIVAAVLAVMAAAMARGQRAGEEAPPFEAESTGGPVKLEQLRGKWVILMFYPKSFTPGCTKEMCSARDAYAKLVARNAVVYGVSLDDLETQKKFKAAHQLPYELISDSKKTLAQLYGVLAPMGLFAMRRTFIISPEGKIAEVITSVSVATHGDDLVAALDRLGAKPSAP
ncbi:MAG: peroxiredoxin [Kiritimatiellae bacterium]|nr:peroxiredoxin [Kiritimatiellia bacterium]